MNGFMFIHIKVEASIEVKVEVSDQNIVALIFLKFNFKCLWHILRYSEAVVLKCSLKRVFLNVSQNS